MGLNLVRLQNSRRIKVLRGDILFIDWRVMPMVPYSTITNPRSSQYSLIFNVPSFEKHQLYNVFDIGEPQMYSLRAFSRPIEGMLLN